MLHPYFKREKGSYDVYVLWVTEKYGWGREPPAFRRAVAWGAFVIGKHRPDPLSLREEFGPRAGEAAQERLRWGRRVSRGDRQAVLAVTPTVPCGQSQPPLA